MSGPWEDYQSAAPVEQEESGPWNDFQSGGFSSNMGDVRLKDNVALNSPQSEINPPTKLSSAIHGFEEGFSYNLADDAAKMVDPAAKERFDNSRKANPILNAVSNFAGAVLSPNPLGKIKALKDAGTLIKMAVTGGKFASEAGLASFGASEKKGLDRLEDVKDTLTNPLTIGLGAVATAAPALPKVIEKSGDFFVDNGKKSYKLGKEMIEALGSKEGQELVTTRVADFEDAALATAKQSLSKLSPLMDDIAAKNADTAVMVSDPLKKTFDFLKKLKPDELLDNERIAKTKLERLVSSFDNGEPKSFQEAYEFKKQLGKLIFDPKEGSARLFNNAPNIKNNAIGLYDDLSKELVRRDKTRTFGDVNKAFTGTYKTYDALDEVGNSLAQAADKLNPGAVGKQNAIARAYSSIPAEYKGAMPDLSKLINEDMPEVITAYDIAAKIAGKNPSRTSLLSQLASHVPVVSQGSRLQMMNTVGQAEAGRGALRKVVEPAGPLSRSGRVLAPALVPEE